MIEPRMLSVKDAARYLGATPWFIRSAIWAGELPSCRLGKRILLDRSDLDKFIDLQKTK